MTTLFIIVGWLVLSIVVAVAANARGRSAGGFFLLSLLVSPLIGLLAVVAMPAQESEWDRQRRLSATRPCPQCAELVKREAQICRYCGHALPPVAAIEQPLPPASGAAVPIVITAVVLLVLGGIVAAQRWNPDPYPGISRQEEHRLWDKYNRPTAIPH